MTFQTLANGLLQVTLANTSIAGATSTNDVLTAVYFTLSPENSMVAQSASVNSVTAIRNCYVSNCNTTNVSGEWAYRDQADFVAYGTPAHLLSSVSFNGTLTSSERIGSTNIAGTTGVGGVDFGLVSSATRFTSSNPLRNTALIRDTVVFYLDPSANMNVSAIGTVGFIYGQSAYNFEGYEVTPEPGTLLAMGSGLIGLVLWRRRSRTPEA